METLQLYLTSSSINMRDNTDVHITGKYLIQYFFYFTILIILFYNEMCIPRVCSLGFLQKSVF